MNRADKNAKCCLHKVSSLFVQILVPSIGILVSSNDLLFMLLVSISPSLSLGIPKVSVVLVQGFLSLKRNSGFYFVSEHLTKIFSEP